MGGDHQHIFFKTLIRLLNFLLRSYVRGAFIKPGSAPSCLGRLGERSENIFEGLLQSVTNCYELLQLVAVLRFPDGLQIFSKAQRACRTSQTVRQGRRCAEVRSWMCAEATVQPPRLSEVSPPVGGTVRAEMSRKARGTFRKNIQGIVTNCYKLLQFVAV